MTFSSAISAGLTTVTDKPIDRLTDHYTQSVTIGRIYVSSTAMQPKNEHAMTHIEQTTTQQQFFYSPLSETTRVNRFQKKHSPTHHPDHHPVSISFVHRLRSIASSLFKLRAWHSFCTTSLHVLFGLPLGLEPST